MNKVVKQKKIIISVRTVRVFSTEQRCPPPLGLVTKQGNIQTVHRDGKRSCYYILRKLSKYPQKNVSAYILKDRITTVVASGWVGIGDISKREYEKGLRTEGDYVYRTL